MSIFLKMAFLRSLQSKLLSTLSSNLWKACKFLWVIRNVNSKFQLNECKHIAISYEFLKSRYYRRGSWCPALYNIHGRPRSPLWWQSSTQVVVVLLKPSPYSLPTCCVDNYYPTIQGVLRIGLRELCGNNFGNFDSIPYTSKHSRGKTFAVHQQYALCRETFAVCRLKLRARLCNVDFRVCAN